MARRILASNVRRTSNSPSESDNGTSKKKSNAVHTTSSTEEEFLKLKRPYDFPQRGNSPSSRLFQQHLRPTTSPADVDMNVAAVLYPSVGFRNNSDRTASTVISRSSSASSCDPFANNYFTNHSTINETSSTKQSLPAQLSSAQHFSTSKAKQSQSGAPGLMLTPDSSIEYYDKEVSPEEGALQFVPALPPSGTTRNMVRRNQPLHRGRSEGFVQVANVGDSGAFFTSWDTVLSNNSAKQSDQLDQLQHQQQQQNRRGERLPEPENSLQDTASSFSGNVVHSRKAVGGRIARLASLFSSRAQVPSDDHESSAYIVSPMHNGSDSSNSYNQTQSLMTHSSLKTPSSIGKGTKTSSKLNNENHSINHNANSSTHLDPPSQMNSALAQSPKSMSTPLPISPAPSSGSSAYVGWPGTQDNRGQTVRHQSSYDDSSLSAGSTLHHRSSTTLTRSGTNRASTNDFMYDKEIKAAALKEMHRWDIDKLDLQDENENMLGVTKDYGPIDHLPSTSSTDRLKINYRRRRIVSCASSNSSSRNRSSPTDDDDEYNECIARVTSDDECLIQHHYETNKSHNISIGLPESDESNSAILGSDAADYHLTAAVVDAQRSFKTSTGIAGKVVAGRKDKRSLSSQRHTQSDVGSYRQPILQQHFTSGKANHSSLLSGMVRSGSDSDNRARQTLFPEIRPSNDRVEVVPHKADQMSSDSACDEQFFPSTIGWGSESSCGAPSSATDESSVSKSFTAYLKTTGRQNPNYFAPPDTIPIDDGSNDILYKSCVGQDDRLKSLRPKPTHLSSSTHPLLSGNDARRGILPPTEGSLAANDRMTPPHRSFANSEGYRGLLDKTKEVPSLMDALDSDSMSSSKTTSVYSGNAVGTGQSETKVRYMDKQTLHSQQRSKHSNSVDGGSSPPSILRNKNKLLNTPVTTAVESQLDGCESDSDVFDGISVSKDSDIFDNISTASPRNPRPTGTRTQQHYPARIAEEDASVPSDNDDQVDLQDKHAYGTEIAKATNVFKIVTLAGGITTIQTSDADYSNRRTASDFDDQLTTSEISSNGYTRIPGLDKMITAGTEHDNSLHGIIGNLGCRPARDTRNASRSMVLEDLTHVSDREDDDDDTNQCDHTYESSTVYDAVRELSQYRVPTSQTKRLLNKYRELSELFDSDMTPEQFEKEEDEHKAFALFEMRSRIMEKDIERGLERQGGTFVVDDIVTTTYYRTAHRVRDAVIVCKAWRDGASISDVYKASLLGRRHERTYFVKRRIRSNVTEKYDELYTNYSVVSSDSGTSAYSGSAAFLTPGRYYWEPVKWLDDTDVMMFRCPSLRSRNLRGYEIFTIGDCQSILLKLTNERCMELRTELNQATCRQIEAEEMLKNEGDQFHGEMTEAEVAYLSSMEEVKVMSKKLVQAEQAFALVRDRIKKLISKYESILIKIETESSIVTNDSSLFSEYSSAYWEAQEQRERQMWARRARRAEIRAEIAAREAYLAKQETRILHEVKERELQELKQKLLEVQSETSTSAVDRSQSGVLARSLSVLRSDGGGASNIHDNKATTVRNIRESRRLINDEKVQDVKQRFRERMAMKKQQESTTSMMSFQTSQISPSNANIVTPTSKYNDMNNSHKGILFRSAGEEMFQQMNFYERSLHSVDHRPRL